MTSFMGDVLKQAFATILAVIITLIVISFIGYYGGGWVLKHINWQEKLLNWMGLK